MKNLIFISFLSLLLFTSCQTNNKSQNNDGYVNIVDTTYVPNSFDIEQIKTTFFKIKEGGKVFKLYYSQEFPSRSLKKHLSVREGYTMIWISTKSEVGVINFNEDELEKFMQNIGLVFDNLDKRLEFFNIRHNGDGEFITGKVGRRLGGDIGICMTDVTPIQLNDATCREHFTLSKENYDKMVSALRKFKEINLLDS